ncbi:MAG: Lipooligosaccharide biosynthesis protein lex-1 [Acinetobacter bereziniae]|uniref:Lipooligosaccharide biosynthesis protein lex-1 n=1 Tax=Acinetobacter bereziniae TaxID=106648 RepID=A0A833UMR8_ACIBZ|nr:MAG: Lipooligosaccharide biosynthesis protein lex-1 [Acinetobacter bereziniae]
MNFVISLDSALERRQHIYSEFRRHSVSFSFFDAVTPATAIESAKHLGIELTRIGFLTQGEIACLLSHVSLWKKMVDEKIEYMTIFEDDVHFGENIQNFIHDFFWIPKNVHLIKLEAFDRKVDLSFFPKARVNDRALYQLKAKHLGGAGYILSKQAAEYFLKTIRDLDELVPVDHILFGCNVKYGKYKAYQMVPAICVQDFYLHKKYDNFPSHLENERAIRHESDRIEQCRQKRAMTIASKVWREVLRLLHQISKFSAFRSLKFK